MSEKLEPKELSAERLAENLEFAEEILRNGAETVTEQTVIEYAAHIAHLEQRLAAYRDACGELEPAELEKVLDDRMDKMGIAQLGDIAEYAQRTEAAERAAESLRAENASLKKVHNRLMDRAKKAGLKLELYDLTKETP